MSKGSPVGCEPFDDQIGPTGPVDIHEAREPMVLQQAGHEHKEDILLAQRDSSSIKDDSNFLRRQESF